MRGEAKLHGLEAKNIGPLLFIMFDITKGEQRLHQVEHRRLVEIDRGSKVSRRTPWAPRWRSLKNLICPNERLDARRRPDRVRAVAANETIVASETSRGVRAGSRRFCSKDLVPFVYVGRRCAIAQLGPDYALDTIFLVRLAMTSAIIACGTTTTPSSFPTIRSPGVT